jgi:hypothetical protein
MIAPSGTRSRPQHIICPFCESGELVSLGPGFARCDSCGLPLVGSTLETLRDIMWLPDVLGTHPCECGHPEMRVLPDRVCHCPACRSEVLPIGASIIYQEGSSDSPYVGGRDAGGVRDRQRRAWRESGALARE